jgi:hypothetical protein
MRVSVFGGSQATPEDSVYAEAVALGRMLAARGHAILTGGYRGTMEAVSRGASEAGGRVIGVTCAEIERWRPVRVNQWVTEEWKRETLVDRLATLIGECDAALALPGGPGTLTEIALTWNLMIVGSIHRRPLILIGGAWERLFDQAFQKMGAYTPTEQRALLTFAPDASSAVDRLEGIQSTSGD